MAKELKKKTSAERSKALSHYDNAGCVHMVDVSAKPETHRQAIASVLVKMKPQTLKKIRNNPKGDPLEISRVAGIAAAKCTADLIPLCHPLLLSHIDVRADFCKQGVAITATVRSTGSTGVEMEALTGAAVAALTVYDMCKAVDHEIVITDLKLLYKSGGKSGEFRASQ
jgi:cyclic pyranopterin monophosphate synthase